MREAVNAREPEGAPELAELQAAIAERDEEILYLRHLAERAQDNLADALDSLDDGLVLFDERGRLVRVNNRYREIFAEVASGLVPGLDAQEVLRRETLVVVGGEGPDFASALEKRLARFRESGERWCAALADGRHLSFEERRTRSGGRIVLVRDATAERSAEATLSWRLAAIEASQDAVAILDGEGRLAYGNAALARLLEAEAGGLLGRPWQELLGPTAAGFVEKRAIPQLAHEGGLWRGEVDLPLAAGGKQPVELALTRLAGGALLLVGRSLAEHQAELAAREDLQQQLFRAQKMEAIGNLAGGIAHDFNNVLASMLGYAGFLVEDLPEGSELQDFAKHIVTAGTRARDLIQQILTFSRRSDDGRAKVEALKLVDETVALLRATLPTSIELKVERLCDSALIEANPTQIGQVLMNICVNARDALSEQRGRLLLRVETVSIDGGRAKGLSQAGIAAETVGPMLLKSEDKGRARMWVGDLKEQGRYLKLTIVDSGAGISREVMNRMFEPFFTTKGMTKGTGLGLAVVQGIVTGHHGAIAIESELGVGTSFSVLLPLADSQELDDEEDAAGQRRRGRGELVLVVDDEPLVAAMTLRTLQRLGYRVVHAGDGQEALALLTEAVEPFAAVVSDQTMPGLTGYDLLCALKEHAKLPQPAFILLTGFSDQVDEARALEAGAAAFLKKPASADDLARALAAALED